MNILLSVLASILIIVDVFALRNLEKKNKVLTQENKKLKSLLNK